MGYYTTYSLDIEGTAPTIQEVASRLDQMYPNLWGADNAGRDHSQYWEQVLTGAEPTTWYEHETDMLAVSESWPEAVFFLDGTGEDSEDCWRVYYHNGKSARHERPTWDPPPYDPAALR